MASRFILQRRLPQLISTWTTRSRSWRLHTITACLPNSTNTVTNYLPRSLTIRNYRVTGLYLDAEKPPATEESPLKEEASSKEETTSTPQTEEEVTPTATPSPSPAQEESKGSGDEFVIPKFADRPADCPEFQNPLHHNNPDMKKMFAEDFAEGEVMPIQPLPPFEGRNPPHIEKLADDILHLNMLEMHELIKMVQDHFGWTDEDVEGSQYMAVGGGGGGGGADAGQEAAEPVVEKTKFDLKLVTFDAKAKVKVIKEVRALTGLGLKEAKELVEGAPKVLKKDMKQEEVNEIKAKFEELGATMEIV